MKTYFRIPLLFFITLLIVNSVYADGWHLSDYQLHMEEPNQKAVISWDGQTEIMILSSAVKSNDISNFAWVIPIQSYSKPKVTAGNISIFKDLVRYFEKEKPDYDSRFLAGGGVEVLESKEIDVYDITILKAIDSTDLISWLNNNGYKVPEEAKPILDKYVSKGDYYFIANKIDLKNKFKEEIDKIVSIYSEKEKQYENICRDINSELSKIGIKDKICQDNRKYHPYSEVFGVISDYINSKANPLNLPLISSKDLGNGITVQERFGAIPFTNSIYDKANPKMFKFLDLNKEKTVITILKNGNVIDTISYRPFRDRYPGPEFLDKWLIKQNLKDIGGLSEQEIQLIEAYIDSRADIIVSPEVEAETNEILTSFADQLNEALGTKIFDCNKLNQDLYYYYSSSSSGTKAIPEEEIPLSVKISAVFYGLRNESEIPQSYFNNIYYAKNDLQRGLGTPLKFEFQPHKPYYPLEISSLNLGKSIIEVYVLTVNPVIDQNNILNVEESKKINSELKRKLAKHINIANAKYVTRLSYKGDLKGLTDDAEFDGKDIMNPPNFPGEKDSYEQDYNFLQKVWNWICNLFS